MTGLFSISLAGGFLRWLSKNVSEAIDHPPLIARKKPVHGTYTHRRVWYCGNVFCLFFLSCSCSYMFICAFPSRFFSPTLFLPPRIFVAASAFSSLFMFFFFSFCSFVIPTVPLFPTPVCAFQGDDFLSRVFLVTVVMRRIDRRRKRPHACCAPCQLFSHITPKSYTLKLCALSPKSVVKKRVLFCFAIVWRGMWTQP